MATDPEAALAKEAQQMRIAQQSIAERWPRELEFIALQARFVKARYDALRKVGFEHQEALALCTRKVEL